jgi:hypothetical protein
MIIVNHSGKKTLKNFKKLQAQCQLRHQWRSAVLARFAMSLNSVPLGNVRLGEKFKSMKNRGHEMNLMYRT